jgi:hypothetical protein
MLYGGGAQSFGLYLVQIALATEILHAGWTWSLVALSFAGWAAAGIEPLPIDAPA